MSIKESALTAVTSITNADFTRIVLSGGGSRRVLVANLAKHIIENYASSSLGGVTRSIKAALDLVATNTYMSVTATPSSGLTLGTTKTINVYRRGAVGFLQYNIIVASATVASHTLCTIPDGYRPATAGQKIATTQSGGVYIISWATDGTVSFYPLAAISSNVFIRENISFAL